MKVTLKSDRPKVVFSPIEITIKIDTIEEALQIYDAWKKDKQLDFALYRALQVELEKQRII